MSTLKQLIAAAVLFGVASPASAHWKVVGTLSTEDGKAVVNATDGSGAGLEVACLFPGELYFTALTGQPYDRTASYASLVPMQVIVDGKTIHVWGTFYNRDGILIVGAEKAYDIAAVDAIFAMRDAAGPIEITFFETRLTFPAENAASTVGQVIDGCQHQTKRQTQGRST